MSVYLAPVAVAAVARLANPNIAGAPRASASVGCDAPAGHQCSFTIFYRAGYNGPSFTIPSGSRLILPNIASGSDRYAVVIDSPPPSTPSCAVELARHQFCKVATFTAGYNN